MTRQTQNRAAEGFPSEPEDGAPGTANATNAAPRHSAEYRRDQTSLVASNEVTILKASDGFGWTGLYAALTDERPHEAFHRAIPGIWFATTFQGVELSRTAGSHQNRALLPADLVSIAAPGESQRDVIGTPVSALHVYLKAEVLAEVESELYPHHRSDRVVIPVFATEDRALVQLLRMISAALDEPAGSNTLKMDYLSRALAAHALQNHSTEKPAALQSRRMQPLSPRQRKLVLGYIEENLGSEIQITDLASLVGLSPVQFMRHFKATMGMTAYQYVMSARIQRAKTLLADPRFTLADVALICGFAHQAHFTSAFKRFVNVPPGAYRREVQ